MKAWPSLENCKVKRRRSKKLDFNFKLVSSVWLKASQPFHSLVLSALLICECEVGYVIKNVFTENVSKFALVWFYGISTIVGYLMLNTLYIYIYIKYMICKHFFRYTQLNDQTVLFQTIQFSHLFTLSLNVKQFYLTQQYKVHIKGKV